MATKTKINTTDVNVNEIHRVFVMNCQSTWHRDLLAAIARHFRCVALKKHNALWLAGANSEKVQEARECFRTVLATFRQTARDLGATNRAAKVAVYTSLLGQLREQLVKRLLPDATVEYAAARSEFVLKAA